MTIDLLKSTSRPFHLADISSTALDTLVRNLSADHPGAVIRLLRGGVLRTAAAFFDHISTAFHLPYHLTGNWHSFKDSLVDLREHNANPHLLVIDRALDLLEEESTEALGSFLQTTTAVHREWQEPNPTTGSPMVPIQYLLADYQSRSDRLRDKVGRMGRHFNLLRWDGDNLIEDDPAGDGSS